ncbi:MAG: divergent polysaccharide deacetylase family protein [Turneriella sp.]
MRKFFAISLAALLTGFLSADGQAAAQDALQDTIQQLESIWGEGLCETVVVKKKGHPLASIACSGSYDNARRGKFLDTLFRNDFKLKSETYKLRPQNGMYLYKTVQSGRTFYFKLFVRNAQDLWPRNPVQGKQAAIYVQNVRSQADLVKWRTLGIPVTFGITFGRSDTQDLLAKLAAYGDEVWLAIPLEDDNVDIADGSLLGISDALNAEKLNDYLKVLDDDEGFHGVSALYCSRFCKNVPALRALFSTLREKNQDKEIIMLDTDVSEASSFYETGRIMNFRTFRAMVAEPHKRPFCPAFRNFTHLNEASAARIMAVDAGDENAFNCLKKVIRSQPADLEFVKVSQMSVTNPFR